MPIPQVLIQSAPETYKWLKWHKNGRQGPFRSPIMDRVELDITTSCPDSPGCKKCSYEHSKKLNYTLDVALGLKIIRQTYDLGFREMVFTGGGEPLVPKSQGTFFTLLRAARLQGFRTVLLTNGIFLSGEILQSLFPYLNVLRISVPYSSHLQRIAPKIENSVRFRNRLHPQVDIYASCLIMPDTPQQEIVRNIGTLDRLGVDGIQYKRTHLSTHRKGSFAANIEAYKDIVDFICGLNHTRVIFLDAKYLLSSEIMGVPLCYFSDFYPFNIGADGKVYACCEHKYREEFLRGDFRNQDAEEILESGQQNPQEIKEKYCFCGCRGDSVNANLHRLSYFYFYLDNLSVTPWSQF